eukprot:3259472-Prymnesium_polylepis.1
MASVRCNMSDVSVIYVQQAAKRSLKSGVRGECALGSRGIVMIQVGGTPEAQSRASASPLPA